jgi:N-acetylglucosamine kinase-like BadF-type ATPase
MFIIAESGATKTDWRSVTDDGSVVSVQTEGLNPMMMSQEQLSCIIGKAVPSLNPEGRQVSHVYFYGAGLVSPQTEAVLESIIGLWCPFSQVEFHTDMEAAARAVFGDGSGVVAIMGTGSNSCLYKSGSIVRNIRPGGYILGDEGGGASLGKAFLADFVKGLLPLEIEEELVAETGLDYAKVVRKVYKEPAASAFMASFAPFIMKRIGHPYMYRLVYECLESFVVRALARYSSDDEPFALKVGVVGSFGCACQEILDKIGREHGLEFVKFLKSPIDELVKYHGI